MVMGTVCLGATDWTAPSWNGGLYPADLPADWRLTFYNTQFGCAWVDYRTWHRLSAAEAMQWLEDTHAGFRFLFETGEAEDAGDARTLALLAPRLGAHCSAAGPDLLWFDRATDLRRLSEELHLRVAGGGTTYLLSRDGSLATIERVRTLLELLDLGPGDGVG
jgi:hypothetical protein